MTGCLRLATNKDRWIEYQRLATTAQSFGMEMNLLSPSEVKKMFPLLETKDLVGASFLPTDGQASPSDVTQSLAKETARAGITVNALCPGYIKTEALGTDPAALAELAKRVPARRLGLPEEIAATVLHLATPAAAYLTGSVIKIDGGIF